MSIVSDATMRTETEIASGPDVFFVLCEDGGNRTALLGTLYAVQLPSSDLSRFRLWDDGEGFDVFFKLHGRWHRVDAVWRQPKRLGLDAAENRPCSVVTFGRRILKKMGVKPWTKRD